MSKERWDRDLSKSVGGSLLRLLFLQEEGKIGRSDHKEPRLGRRRLLFEDAQLAQLHLARARCFCRAGTPFKEESQRAAACRLFACRATIEYARGKMCSQEQKHGRREEAQENMLYGSAHRNGNLHPISPRIIARGCRQVTSAAKAPRERRLN